MVFLFFLLWLIFSMRFGIDIFLAGIIIAALLYWFINVHLRYKRPANKQRLRKLLLGTRYVFLLLIEAAKANIAVLRIVFSRTIKVNPRIIYFRSGLKKNSSRVVLANSITLTPGTITIALDEDVLCVHCLDSKFSEGIEDSVFVKHLRKMEEETPAMI